MENEGNKDDYDFLTFVLNSQFSILHLLLTLLCLFAPLAEAAAPPGRCYTLAEIESMALENSSALKSDRLVLDGMRSEKEKIGKKSGWKLHGGYGYREYGPGLSQNWTENPIRSGESAWTEIAWTYPIWERWRNLKYEEREKQTHMSEHRSQFNLNRREVLYQVREAYYLARQYRRLDRGAQASVKQLEKLAGQVKLRREYGFSLDSEVMEAEGELLARRKELEQFEQAYRHQLQNLSRLVGADISIAGKKSAEFKAPPQEKLKSALKEHPALLLLEARANREGTLADSSRYKSLDIYAESGAGIQERRNSNFTPDVRFGIGFSMPIGNEKVERLEKQSHLSRQDAWEALRRAKLQEMEGDLAQIYLEMDSIDREQESVRHKVDEAREKIRILQAQQEYPAAGADSLWLKMLQALKFQWEARKRFTELKYQKWICYAKLRRLAGDKVGGKEL